MPTSWPWPDEWTPTDFLRLMWGCRMGRVPWEDSKSPPPANEVGVIVTFPKKNRAEVAKVVLPVEHDPPSIAEWSDRDVYFGVATRRPSIAVDKSGTLADCAYTAVYHAEVDHSPEVRAQVTWDEVVSAVGWQPSLMVRTSPLNVHLYWVIDAHDAQHLADVAAGNRAIGSRLRQHLPHHKVDAIHDVTRLMRVPGTTNHKDPEHPYLVHVEDVGECLCYDSAEIPEWVREAEPVGHHKSRDETIASALECIPPEDYTEWLSVGQALHAWRQQDGLEVWCEWSARSTKYVAGECEAKWRGFRAGRGRTLATLYYIARRHGWAGNKERVDVQSPHDARTVVLDEVLRCMVLATPARGVDVDALYYQPRPGEPWVSLTRAHLRRAVMQQIEYYRGDKTCPEMPRSDYEYVVAAAPEYATEVVEVTGLPHIHYDRVGLYTAGRTLHARDWSAAHKHRASLYQAAPLLRTIVDNRTWPEPVHRARFLSLLLTGILRPSIAGVVPLYLLLGPHSGCGKDYLARCLWALVLGQEPSPTQVPKNTEEWAKSLLSCALSAQSLLHYENAPTLSRIGSPDLDSAVSSGRARGRKLGGSRMVDASWRALVTISGSQITPSHDLRRRSLAVETTGGSSYVMEGEELILEILARRRETIGGVIGWARWLEDRDTQWPGYTPTPGFRPWSDLVRCGVHYTTGIDVSSRDERQDCDDARWVALCEHLADAGGLGSEELTRDPQVRQLLEDCGVATIDARGAQLQSHVVGRHLRRAMAGQPWPLQGWRLEQRRSKNKRKWIGEKQ